MKNREKLEQHYSFCNIHLAVFFSDALERKSRERPKRKRQHRLPARRQGTDFRGIACISIASADGNVLEYFDTAEDEPRKVCKICKICNLRSCWSMLPHSPILRSRQKRPVAATQIATAYYCTAVPVMCSRNVDL